MPEQKTKIENCNQCGMCNLDCPIYAVLLKESAAPRFKAFLAKKKSYREIFYLCTNCASCTALCPANVDLDCLKIRKKIIDDGHETKANKLMKENIMQRGNPFGKVKKGSKIEQYFT